MMKKSKSKRLSQKFTLKVVLLLFVAIVLSASICTTRLYCYISNELKREEYRKAEENIKVIIANVNAYLSDVRTFTVNMLLNDEFQLTFKNHGKTVIDYYSRQKDIRKSISSYIAMYSSVISDMYIIDWDGSEIGDISKNYIEQDAWLGELNFPAGFYLYEENDETMQFRYVLNIPNKTNFGDYIGKIVLLLNYQEFLRSIAISSAYPSEMVIVRDDQMIANKNGAREPANVLKEMGDYCIENNLSEAEVNGDYYFVLNIPETNWTLLSCLKKDDVESVISDALSVSVHTLILVVLAAVIVASIALMYMTYPLSIIMGGIQRVSESMLDTRITVRTGDELEQIAESFNQMTERIDALLLESIAREKQASELQMQLLMAQINPHFVCNTLNLLLYSAQKRKDTQEVELIRAFINILQVTMNLDPKGYLTIEEEIKYIDSYVLINCFRYSNIADVEWSISPDLYGYRIRRMVLYPIVENSILHGFLPSGKHGTIRISMCKTWDGNDESDEKGQKQLENKSMRNQLILVTVEDNGQGMTQDQLKRVMESFNEGISSGIKSIGLKNVNSRIMLDHPAQKGLLIESLEGLGTLVSFEIPMI